MDPTSEKNCLEEISSLVFDANEKVSFAMTKYCELPESICIYLAGHIEESIEQLAHQEWNREGCARQMAQDEQIEGQIDCLRISDPRHQHKRDQCDQCRVGGATKTPGEKVAELPLLDLQRRDEIK